MEVMDEFEDLFSEVDTLQDSSQESLTGAAAGMMLGEAYFSPLEGYRRRDSSGTSGSQKTWTARASLNRESSIAYCPPDVPQMKFLPLREAIGENAIPSLIDLSHSDPVRKIEAIIETIVDQLLHSTDTVRISLKRRPTTAAQAQSSSSNDGRPQKHENRVVCFPGKNEEEAWRFVVLRLLELIHEALRTNVVVSKRDIFYQDPALFNHQTHVDRYVDDIAFTFDLPRSCLNVAAVAKGLIAGSVSFNRRDGTTVSAATGKDGILVPVAEDVLCIDMNATKWILVIEKEASFRSIASSTFWDTAKEKGIIITGKGYPDIATRAILHMLSHPTPQNGFAMPPVYGLVDLDPDGIAILLVYKHGSVAMAHESARLCCPMLETLGLQSAHAFGLADDDRACQGLLRLSKRDRQKARRMLEWANLPETNSRYDLQTMLMLNLKAELQLLDTLPAGMTQLLISKLPRG